MHTDVVVASIDLKFAPNDPTGEFEGYGSVFGNVDQHGDKILPGAFAASLAEHKAAGRRIPMHLNHGLPGLGGRRGVGVWNDLTEDGRGLRVKGRISGMNTDPGRLLYEQIKDGAFPGLSIGYRLAPGGAAYGTKAGEPRRTLKALHLAEVSLVDDPSNPGALVEGIKSAAFQADTGSAAGSIASAMRIHDRLMGGSSYDYGSASPKDRAQLMNHLRDAHEALTGDRAPIDLGGWKAAPTLRDVEAMLREECGLSRKDACALAER